MKKILCIILSVLFVVCSVNFVFSINEETKFDSEPFQSEYENSYNKLHFYFGSTDSNDKTGARISNDNSSEPNEYLYIDNRNELDNAVEVMNEYHQNYAEEDEPIIMTVEFRSNYEKTKEYNEFLKEREEVETTEELREFRTKINGFSKEFHEDVTGSNIDKLDNFKYNTINRIDYSPFVRMTINKDEISEEDLLSLVNDEDIINVSFAPEDEAMDEDLETSWYRVKQEIGAQTTIFTKKYTGEGIKVGVLEAAVCDTSHDNLSDMSITIEPGYGNDTLNSETKSDDIAHATKVTSIITLMAPDAEIYASRNTNNGLSWFISQNCDVVNCSYGLVNTEKNGDIYEFVPGKAVYRFGYDSLFDYQIKANLITVIKSAGNVSTTNTHKGYNPDGYITSPGLAHNVITVGGLSCSLGFFDYELEHHPDAAYITATDRTKPEVSALFGVEVDGFGLCEGTSFAAPQVTGVVALIMCKYAKGALDPHAIKAMLISGAKETENFSNITNSFFDTKVGAGCINLDNMLDSECITYTGTSNASIYVNNYGHTYNLSLKKNDVLQVGLCWLANKKDNINIIQITDYDLHLFDPSGNLVCTSSLGNFSNSEFIRYKASSKGTYTIKVYQNGELPDGFTSDQFAFVCNIL